MWYATLSVQISCGRKNSYKAVYHFCLCDDDDDDDDDDGGVNDEKDDDNTNTLPPLFQIIKVKSSDTGRWWNGKCVPKDVIAYSYNL